MCLYDGPGLFKIRRGEMGFSVQKKYKIFLWELCKKIVKCQEFNCVFEKQMFKCITSNKTAYTLCLYSLTNRSSTAMTIPKKKMNGNKKETTFASPCAFHYHLHFRIKALKCWCGICQGIQ